MGTARLFLTTGPRLPSTGTLSPKPLEETSSSSSVQIKQRRPCVPWVRCTTGWRSCMASMEKMRTLKTMASPRISMMLLLSPSWFLTLHRHLKRRLSMTSFGEGSNPTEHVIIIFRDYTFFILHQIKHTGLLYYPKKKRAFKKKKKKKKKKKS